MKTSDLVRIERKLDLIIDAFGLSSAHRLSPVEVTDTAQKILLQFQKKSANAQNYVRNIGLNWPKIRPPDFY